MKSQFAWLWCFFLCHLHWNCCNRLNTLFTQALFKWFDFHLFTLNRFELIFTILSSMKFNFSRTFDTVLFAIISIEWFVFKNLFEFSGFLCWIGYSQCDPKLTESAAKIHFIETQVACVSLGILSTSHSEFRFRVFIFDKISVVFTFYWYEWNFQCCFTKKKTVFVSLYRPFARIRTDIDTKHFKRTKSSHFLSCVAYWFFTFLFSTDTHQVNWIRHLALASMSPLLVLLHFGHSLSIDLIKHIHCNEIQNKWTKWSVKMVL